MRKIEEITIEKERQKITSLIHLITKEEGGVIYSTRLLKFLYLIDEGSIKEIGIPVSSIEYKIAEKGPLACEVWDELKPFGSKVYTSLVEIVYDSEKEGNRIKATGEANLKLFSKNELEIIKRVITKYKGVKTDEIVKELHAPDSIWSKRVEKDKITFQDKKVSNVKIVFSILVENDPVKKYLLESYYNSFLF